MEISVSNVGPISEENDGLLITLFLLAEKAICVGTKRLDTEGVIVQDNTLFIKDATEYLCIKPSGLQQLFRVDENYVFITDPFSIFVEDIKTINRDLEKILISIGVLTPDWF